MIHDIIMCSFAAMMVCVAIILILVVIKLFICLIKGE